MPSASLLSAASTMLLEEAHPRPDTALVSNIIPVVILFILVHRRFIILIQVNMDVLDTTP